MQTLTSPPPPGTPPRRPPFLVRLFTSPVTPGAVERRLARLRARALAGARPLVGWAWGALFAAGVAALAWSAHAWWTSRTPWLAPRHRAEAVCFALAAPPRFAPELEVQPNAALVPGHFPPGAPPALALQEVMHFTDDMTVRQRRHRVGDFDVTSLWLRLPEPGGPAHWLVLAWVENGDLAVCSFRFESRGPVIPRETLRWGNRLMNRVLRPELFVADRLPDVRLRATREDALAAFGPAAD
uniref:Uncharacterized protein n=1 Tax=Eiseniibacteriota bacterium TaxID=2212470 RepID=A0A832I3G9_UNCEI